MITGIQYVGIFFALVMIYLTHLYYKKSSYSTRSFVFWLIIWIGFLITTFFPQTLYGLMEELSVERTVDLFIIGGFMLFSVIIFVLFATVKSIERKVEVVVRKVALANKQEKSTKATRKK